MLRPRLYHDTAHTVARIRGKNGGVTSLCMLPRHTRSHSEFRTLLPPLHMQAVLGSESSGPTHCPIQEPCLAARGRRRVAHLLAEDVVAWYSSRALAAGYYRRIAACEMQAGLGAVAEAARMLAIRYVLRSRG